MDLQPALTAIKQALATVPTNDWNVRVGLCLAVQTVENELKRLQQVEVDYQADTARFNPPKP